MKENLIKLSEFFLKIKRSQDRASLFSYFLTFFTLLSLAACNPVKTKLGEDYAAGINISLSNSVVTVSNTQVATSNSVNIIFSLKDQFGSPYVSAKPIITFSTVGGTSVGSFSSVINNNNGTYSATFSGVTPGTATTIHAQVDGQEITSSLPTIQVTTGNYSLSNSVISLSSGSVASNSTVTVTLTTKDASDTQLPDGGLTVLFSHSGGTSTGTFGAVTDNLDGTYSATLTGVTAGTATDVHASIGGGAVTSTSPTVTVSAGTAIKLGFVQGPSAVASGASISPNITVEALDFYNNRVTSYATDVVIAIDTNPSSGTLSGTLTKTPSSGVATFNDLSINYYGTGYKLIATSGLLATATSGAFNITATALTYDLPFTSVTTPIYTTLYTSSSWSAMEFINDLVRLIPTVQTDDAATTGTMDAGTASGIVMGTLTDGVNSGLKLGNGGGCNGSSSDCAKQSAAEIYELNSSWTPQWANLISYWKMNNDWNDSKGSNHGTVNNVPTFTSSSKLGSTAGNFNGSDQSLTAPLVSSAQNSVTMMAWFKSTSPTQAGQMVIYNGSDNAGNGYGFSVNKEGVTTGVIYILKGGLAWYATGYTLSDSNWHHGVLVIASNGTPAFYLDGRLIYTGSAGQPNAPTLKTEIAKNDYPVARHFYGAIDDVAFWTAPLSAIEIQTIYDRQKSQYSGTFVSRIMDAKSASSWTTLSWLPTLPFLKELPDAACPGATCTHVNNESSNSTTGYSSLVGSTGATGANDLMTGIVGLWHLNEASWIGTASEVIDDSGKGFHGVRVGDATTVSEGRFNRGGIFDGSGDYVNLTNFTGLDSANAFTISLWLRPTVLPFTNWTGLFAVGAEGARTVWLQGVTGASTIRLNFNTEAAPLECNTSPTTNLRAGVWNHLVATWNGSVCKIYFDGTVDPVALTSTGTTLVNSGGNRYIGFMPGYAAFNGSIDEVAVWSRALHVNEVKQLYQRGSSRLKYQIRTCNDNACAGESWQGPDGTSGTYFSELNNNTTPLTGAGDVKATLPSMLFSAFTTPPTNNQYFQYRTILESDSATSALMPELKSTTVDPIHYDSSSLSIYGNNGIAFSELNAFSESLGSGGCTSGVGYNLSLDKATWKYWNGSAWVTANGTAAQSNIATVIQTNASTFGTQVGKGTVYVKAYLKSSGTSKCELDNIQIGGNR